MPGATTAIDRFVASRLAAALEGTSIGIALWDGWRAGPAGDAATFLLHVKDRSSLLRLLLRPESSFGECYTRASIAVDGDLAAMLTSVFRRGWEARRARSLRLPGLDLKAFVGPRRDSAAHYELGSDFYRLWLDERLVYTCAWFEGPDATLEQAQQAKLELVCRKLRLRSGERVVELGSGWGALALHMASTHGVRVRAFNVCREQVEWSREAADRCGLGSRVEFVLDDWRSARGEADAVVSVGMLEHVGLRHYRSFGAVVARLLGGSGRALVHSIGRHRPMPTNPWIGRRIFPGGLAPSLGQMRRLFEPNDLAVVHVENLRPHYTRTLDCWLDRFRRRRDDVVRLHGEEFARSWELYLASSRASFASGWSQLHQVLCAPARSDIAAWELPRP